MVMDPYAVLGVTPSSTDDEIKKQYRALSRKYHRLLFSIIRFDDCCNYPNRLHLLALRPFTYATEIK